MYGFAFGTITHWISTDYKDFSNWKLSLKTVTCSYDDASEHYNFKKKKVSTKP